MYRYDIIIFINIWKAKMNQMEEMIYRIKRMELYYDTIFNAAHNAPELLKDETVSKMLEVLTDYYTNGQWMCDYEADERGEIPRNLKRGVLSEDAVYDLLSEVDRVKTEMRAPLEDVPLDTYNRYIEIGEIKVSDKNDDVRTIEISVGSAIFDKEIKRQSIGWVLKEITRLCRNKKAELIFKGKEGGQWEPLDWAYSVYLIVCRAMEKKILDSFVIWTAKNENELNCPDERRFRTENDRKTYHYLVDMADEIVRM